MNDRRRLLIAATCVEEFILIVVDVGTAIENGPLVDCKEARTVNSRPAYGGSCL